MTGTSATCNTAPSSITTVVATSETTYPSSVACGVAVPVDPSLGSRVTLQFTAVDLQAGADFVWVHDGLDATAPVVTFLSSLTSFYAGTGPDSLYPFSAIVSSGPSGPHWHVCVSRED
jgi:hypothetical protein